MLWVIYWMNVSFCFYFLPFSQIDLDLKKEVPLPGKKIEGKGSIKGGIRSEQERTPPEAEDNGAHSFLVNPLVFCLQLYWCLLSYSIKDSGEKSGRRDRKKDHALGFKATFWDYLTCRQGKNWAAKHPGSLSITVFYNREIPSVVKYCTEFQELIFSSRYA